MLHACIDMRLYESDWMEQRSTVKCEPEAAGDRGGFLQSTWSRFQLQVVEFLEQGFNEQSSLPVVSQRQVVPVPSTFWNASLRAPAVMHPNLVCTLKSITLMSSSSTEEFQDYCHYSSTCTTSADTELSADMAEVLQPAGSLEQSLPHCSSHTKEEAVVVSVELIHNRRPYGCAYRGCERTFRNPQTMRMHHRTHLHTSQPEAAGKGALMVQVEGPGGSSSCAGKVGGVRAAAGQNKKIPSRCPSCDKTFVGLYELRRHFGRKHSQGEKRYACPKCSKRFHVEVDLRDHEKLCGEPITCICGIKFAFKCNLVAHKRSHLECQLDHVEKDLPLTPK